MDDVGRRQALAQQFRVDSVRMSAAAKSGHPTSAMSAADLMAVLIDKYLRYDFDEPKSPANDRLVFSKGHASTLLYAIFRAAGAISDEELISYRRLGSRLEGHPTPVLPWVDVATGSLGQGLPIGVGMALAQKRLARVAARTWVLCGDSEMAEGSMWEAFEHAGHYGLDNLTAIIDVNRLGQRGETMVGWKTDVYVERATAFGWHAIEIDGHDLEQIDRAYAEVVATDGRPTVVVARTVKGKGVAAVENEGGWHGKPLDDPEAAIEELGGQTDVTIEVRKPDPVKPNRFPDGTLELPRYELGSEVATRKAYGEAFAALVTRAYDFVRMAAVSRARLCLSGSHAGVSIGEDGPSQMGLEDIAALRAVHGSVVLHPCDANPTAKLVAAMADVDGIAYVRTLRPATEVIYGPDEQFEIGGSRLLRSSDEDDVPIVAAGITVREALTAADRLAEDGIAARVIDLYSLKPVDVGTLAAAAEATGGRIVTVEDHWPEGGLGDAVLAALADSEEPPRVVKLAVRGMPSSGKPEELLAAAGIDTEHIAEAARRLVMTPSARV